MPGFFNTLTNMRPTAYSSSSGHRHTQRVQAVTQILGSGIQNLDTKAIIPAKFAQILIALFSLFRTDTYGSEKGVQFLQFSLAATQLALIIALFVQDNTCEDESNALCKSKLLVDLFFEGLLAFSFALAEASKDQTDTPPLPTSHQPTDGNGDAPVEPGVLSINIDSDDKGNPGPTLVIDHSDMDARKDQSFK